MRTNKRGNHAGSGIGWRVQPRQGSENAEGGTQLCVGDGEVRAECMAMFFAALYTYRRSTGNESTDMAEETAQPRI